MIELREIHFRHPGAVAPVFDAFSWRVTPGEHWAVIGPSGCGKSTLLLLVAGLLRPTAGVARVNGASPARADGRAGLVLQDYELLPWATVLDNAMLGLRLAGRRAAAARALARAWLDRLGIAELAGRLPGALSGGQRQRAALARTFALEPPLLLMDEPFSALDPDTREALESLTLELCAAAGTTLVLVTHDAAACAFAGQRVLRLAGAGNRDARILENPHRAEPAWRLDLANLAFQARLRATVTEGAPV